MYGNEAAVGKSIDNTIHHQPGTLGHEYFVCYLEDSISKTVVICYKKKHPLLKGDLIK